MTNERKQVTLPREKQARREWIKPVVHNMSAGRAEIAGDTSVDGSATLS